MTSRIWLVLSTFPEIRDAGKHVGRIEFEEHDRSPE
jgi:hypothetical protein